ncbi:hypothetical protein LZ554_006679 [Drepanopeziza brunnea f. sp. 'monogermtubi']|nr:hypothetical protein LZ554_006679 [Drepanopeziza brunnea f. sp. 'monogermtubi']
MFELPDAKRIRRSDFNRSRSSSPASSSSDIDPSTEALLHARLAALYGPVSFPAPLDTPSTARNNTLADSKPTRKPRAAPRRKASPTSDSDSASNPDSDSDSDSEPATPAPAHDDGASEAREYEFALFAGGDAVHRNTVILSPSDDATGPGRILRPRPREYFFAPPAEGVLKARICYSAVSGEEVRARSRGRAWGLEVPWRVRVLKLASGPPVKTGLKSYATGGGSHVEKPSGAGGGAWLDGTDVGGGGDSLKGSRTKPNKRRRIFLREERRRRDAAEEARREVLERKMEAEKEKRVRLNRAKKVKRRLKEKAKKAEGKAGSGDGDGDGEGEGEAGVVSMADASVEEKALD